MKQSMITIVLVSLLLSFTAQAGQINFKTLNPIMDSLLQNVLKNDEMFVEATPSFDEVYSDLDAEKLRYHLNGKLKNTPWESKSATFSTTSTYESERTANHEGIWVKAEIRFQTDILAAARHSAMKSIEADNKNIFTGNEAEILKIFEKQKKVSTMAELYELIMQARALGEKSLINEIKVKRESARDLLDTRQEQEDGESAQSQALDREKKIDQLIRTIEAYRSYLNYGYTPATQTILISGQGPSDILLSLTGDDVKPEKMSITLEADELRLNLEFLIRLDRESLDELKTSLSKRFSGVENSDPEIMEEMKEDYRSALATFKKIIRNRKQNEKAGVR